MLTERTDSSESFNYDNDSFTKMPTIDDFEFIKPISRGAFGKVFLGHKKGKSDKLYAIKVMKKVDMINKNLKDQVVTERDAMARSVSPFIVQLYYSIQSQQNLFLVMEYLIGGDVKSLLSVAGFFDEPMAIMYTAEVTLALEYLHAKGIIHRDLKPDNMLITKTGHIKLTDFGLSKINMSFREVPMTPKTPMPYSQIKYDDHRTPGQILSLRSSFAFSVKKEVNNQSCATTPSFWNSSARTPLSDISVNKTPHSKLVKAKSLREVVLSQSTTKTHPPVIPETPTDSLASTPPVKRLMSTLQDSLNWTKSSTETTHSVPAKPSVKSSVRSDISVPRKPLGLSFSGMDSCCFSPSSVELSSDMYENSTELSDNVFEHSSLINSSRLQVNGLTSVDRSNDAPVGKCNCKTDERNKVSCHECGSHLKVPSRQETMTDETPQMHRTDESVWNSYAAKNLRSLRDGEYSEDSEDNDISNKENQRDEKPLAGDFRRKCAVKSVKPRKLVKTKSFSYPSDEELDCGSWRRSKHHKRFARKRSFQDVAQSPVHRTHSADSGLTQELRLFHLEPFSKRSNSFPRTRIRFNSGSSDTESKDLKSFPKKNDSKPKENVKQFVPEFSRTAHFEMLSPLSKEESRQNETMSVVLENTPISGTDKVDNAPNTCDKKIIPVRQKHSDIETLENSVPDSLKDLFDDTRKTEQQTEESIEAFAAIHKRVTALKTNMVSSLKSEGDVKMNINSDLSSICVSDSDFPSSVSYDMETSVFTSGFDSTWEKKFSSFSNEASSVPQDEVSVPPTPPLLPPPPPKNRHPSGKKPLGKLKFNSVTSCIPPYVYNESRNSSHGSNVPMTPESTGRHKVNFNTPSMWYPHTPHTPLQKALIRSHSFAATMKTPYRTPKSVRRAPLPTEERILGTPDYLAPEILQQQPHGKEVDWWALGVCLFEFLTGVPPFNDQTPDRVFENILNRDIPWPEGEEALSAEAQEAIDSLLTVNPANRPGARAVRKMAAFDTIDWHNLLEMEAPFIPQPDDLTDTSYFEARNQLHDLFVSEVDF